MNGAFSKPVTTIVSILVALGFATASADADLHGYDVKSILDMRQRPRGFYRSIEDSDPACRPILLSLNKEYRPTPDMHGPTANLAADVLLGSTLELPWRRKIVQTRELSSWPLDYARINWAWDDKARPSWIYRWGFYGENRRQNELIVSDKIPAELTSDQTIVGDVIRDLGGADIEINSRTVPSLWRLDDPPQDDTFILNVVLVSGKAFILAANAIQVERAGSGRSGGKIDVFILRFGSDTKIALACRFRSVK
jgi:hypothetical protein